MLAAGWLIANYWALGKDIRFCALLMNWTPSLRNSRGTSSISCTWSAIVVD